MIDEEEEELRSMHDSKLLVLLGDSIAVSTEIANFLQDASCAGDFYIIPQRPDLNYDSLYEKIRKGLW